MTNQKLFDISFPNNECYFMSRVLKAAGCYVKRDCGGGKGEALIISQEWRERRRRQGHRGVRRWGRDRWVLVFWYGYR